MSDPLDLFVVVSLKSEQWANRNQEEGLCDRDPFFKVSIILFWFEQHSILALLILMIRCSSFCV